MLPRHICFIALFSYILLLSCSKKDKTPPEITLKGDAYIVISLNSPYVDPGATANDDEDGILTVQTSGTVDTNFAGTYIISYSAMDAAGNEATTSRTIVVRNDSQIYNGSYNTMTIINNDTIYFGGSFTASNILNNRIWLVGYSDLQQATVYADLRHDTISIPIQDVSAGNPLLIHILSGNGFIKTLNSHLVFEIDFTDSVSGIIKNGKSVYTKTN